MSDPERPLAPASQRRQTNEVDRAISTELKQSRRHRSCVRWCGCVTATVLVIVILIVILAFTVFQVKDPKIRTDFVTVQGLEVDNSAGGLTLKTDVNVTLSAGLSIKNPNSASFKFNGTETTIYYDGISIGYATTPAGVAKARKTFGMNVTVDVFVSKMLGARKLVSDVASGSLSLDTSTKISGRVNIINIVKKHVDLELNCTVVVELSSENVQIQRCNRHVSL